MEYLDFLEIQKCQKEILGFFISFCEQNSIDYSIWAGSFIGAVRHKDIIPWDDDIDLAMTRENYNKLIKILKNSNFKISENIEAIGFELENSDWPFIKIINKSIVVDEIADCDKYLWIDVFPLDYVPNISFFRKLYDLRVFIYRRIFFLKREQIRKINYKSKNIFNSVLKKLARIILSFFSYRYIVLKYINLCSKYKNKIYLCNNIWGVGSREMFPKDLSEKFSKYKFGNLEVNGYENYDFILTKRYGDYMAPPSINKRLTHGFKAYRKEDEGSEK